jgi:hypothetical protein
VLAKLGVHSRAQAVALVLGGDRNGFGAGSDIEAQPDFVAHELLRELDPV